MTVREHGLQVSCLMGYAALEDIALQERIAEARADMECAARATASRSG